MSEEEILKINPYRFTIFPIKYNKLWDLYKQQESSFWTAEEIDYNQDLDSWNKLTPDEKFFMKNILAFFAGSDGIVLENLMSNFSTEVQIPEARFFYGAQGYIEQVHSQTYSQLIDTFITDQDEKLKLFNAIETIPCVRKKANWAIKWMTKNKKDPLDFAKRIISFIIVEGIFFSGSFCSIFWLRSRGLVTKAIGHSNELIARDEALHCNFGIAIYELLKRKVPENTVHEIFKEAVEIEKEFITESLPCKLIGMNSDLMIKYIKFVADYWVSKLNYSKIYNVENPFQFMDLNSLDGKTNFFEKRVTEYRKSYSVTKASDRKIELDENF